jgi:hypothetical protein
VPRLSLFCFWPMDRALLKIIVSLSASWLSTRRLRLRLVSTYSALRGTC